MWYRSYESSSPKKVLTYLFYVVCSFWIIITLIIGYQFLNANGKTVDKKWWTFVEAIFDDISYLPYLKNDWQSVFYQSFLFDSCISYNQLNQDSLEGGLCNIQTSDYQTYEVSLNLTWRVWNDWALLGLDDIYFTYEKIIHQNVWWLKTLVAYQDVKVEREENSIKVTFPTATTDNNYFFTYFILPSHVLANAQYSDYIGVFAANPITSACWKVQPKSSDPQSLVFNLMDCEDTNLWYYQIKNYSDFEAFSRSVIEEWNTIVDMYAHQLQLWDYARKNIIKSDILSFFFNTKSPKMKVRLRRALWWLINAKFYIWDEYWKFLKMYTDPLLNNFYSDGSNIQEFINRVSLTEQDDWVQQKDLEDSWVQPLKSSISINGVERKFVFYTPKRDDTFNLQINFSNQFENIKITDTKWNEFSPKNYNKMDKKVTYPLEVGKNLRKWLNQYTIVWTIKWQTYTIANIDLYMLETTEKQQDDANSWKINVVYYNNLESNFAVKQLKKILEEAQISENFVFEQVASPEALEAKLIMGDYDIMINTITVGMKKDVLKILTTSDPMVNPSKYTNPNLTSLFKQYTKGTQREEIINQINAIFAQDMPLVIVGYPYDFVNLKSNLMESAFWTDEWMYEYNWRDHVYQHVTLLQSKDIEFSQIKDVKKLLKFIFTEVGKWALFDKFWGDKKAEVVVNTWENVQVEGEQEIPVQEEPVIEEPVQEEAPIVYWNESDPFAGLLKPAE